ncbi:hypothetical protein HNQ96_004998 [Aminobacter lissarensis]|uniref:FAD-dependent urate hydroxylase HpyO/Asp monooxygenase CreE-like FAD/NAD(P)-binding domain-containing protein n=2 Tax=Aminobacter carboxidus TaxID=376165 RepID=A0A8E1WJP1_9HYPH|nr:hypothetical protein [Aminobacter lissarensis]
MADVAIVGAGMSGLCAAAALNFAGLSRVRLFDKCPPGKEGPWVTYARMNTLRTPKEGIGPALGIPSLTYRAWHEARFGATSWEEVVKAPRTAWMDYLNWYRSTLGLQVENNTTVASITPVRDGLLRLGLHGPAQNVAYARRVVLATGFPGFGGALIPQVFRDLPKRFWAHSSELIDYRVFKDKRVGVLGIGASALDNAATALENGASKVDIIVRRSEIPAIQKFASMAGLGGVKGYWALPDDAKIWMSRYEIETQNPAPRLSLLRLQKFDNFFVHVASPIERIEQADEYITLLTPRSAISVDFMVLGTGFANQPSDVPELAEVAPKIKLWRDVFRSEFGPDENLGYSPYLGPSFEFAARTDVDCPGLANIHCFNYSASLSHGKLTSAVPTISEAASRLVNGIVQSLFLEDREIHQQKLRQYAVREFDNSEWPII